MNPFPFTAGNKLFPRKGVFRPKTLTWAKRPRDSPKYSNEVGSYYQILLNFYIKLWTEHHHVHEFWGPHVLKYHKHGIFTYQCTEFDPTFTLCSSRNSRRFYLFNQVCYVRSSLIGRICWRLGLSQAGRVCHVGGFSWGRLFCHFTKIEGMILVCCKWSRCVFLSFNWAVLRPTVSGYMDHKPNLLCLRPHLGD